jgi:hypothetical protein
MTTNAPHLPPKACHVKTYHAIKTLPSLLFFVLIGILTSITVTLVTVVWVAPTIIPEQIVTTIQNQNRTPESVDISSFARASLDQMVYEVYDVRGRVNNGFYSRRDRLFEFITFSSDGWAVAYYDGYEPQDEDNWEIISANGVSNEIAEVFYDEVSHLIYIKIVGNRFPFVSFVDWLILGDRSTVFAHSPDGWKKTSLRLSRKSSHSDIYDIWDTSPHYTLADDFMPSTIIVDERGDLVGMTDATGHVIYGWLIDAQYSEILSTGETHYSAPLWRGYPVVGSYMGNGRLITTSGFYIAKVVGKTTTSSVNRGDIVVAIGNESVDELDLARRILLSPQTFTVTVLRDGREFDIIVTKEIIK